MGLSIGIVGLPNVGKSTLFNALTKKGVPAENYPFCTIDPSVGVVAVPDERLNKLSQFSKSAKTISAIVEFVDIAGLVKGASEGAGLGNKFLSHIREVDAIAEVVRLFHDDKIIHVDREVNPLRDIDVINFELILADLEIVEKRLLSLSKELKSGKKEAVFENETLQKAKVFLESGKLLTNCNFNDEENIVLKKLNLLTIKPIFYVFNVSQATTNEESILEKIKGSYVKVDPIFEVGLDELIKKGYEVLDLITFFTTGSDETRAWTTKRNSTAPVAGAAIHTDFCDRFIRAEVIAWDKLLEAGSYANAWNMGWVRIEGKDYIVQDGDVIEFKI